MSVILIVCLMTLVCFLTVCPQYLEHLASFYLLLSMEPSERISPPPLEKYITHIRILRQSCSKKILFFQSKI